jgi:thiol-disulfide isomerase/thioredoxin
MFLTRSVRARADRTPFQQVLPTLTNETIIAQSRFARRGTSILLFVILSQLIMFYVFLYPSAAQYANEPNIKRSEVQSGPNYPTIKPIQQLDTSIDHVQREKRVFDLLYEIENTLFTSGSSTDSIRRDLGIHFNHKSITSNTYSTLHLNKALDHLIHPNSYRENQISKKKLQQRLLKDKNDPLLQEMIGRFRHASPEKERKFVVDFIRSLVDLDDEEESFRVDDLRSQYMNELRKDPKRMRFLQALEKNALDKPLHVSDVLNLKHVTSQYVDYLHQKKFEPMILSMNEKRERAMSMMAQLLHGNDTIPTVSKSTGHLRGVVKDFYYVLAGYPSWAVEWQRTVILPSTRNQLKKTIDRYFIRNDELRIIIFFGTFCAHCRGDVIPFIQAIKSNKQVELEVIAVDYLQDNAEEKEKTVHEVDIHGLRSHEDIIDETSHEYIRQYKIVKLPTFLIVKHGKEIGRLEHRGESRSFVYSFVSLMNSLT